MAGIVKCSSSWSWRAKPTRDGQRRQCREPGCESLLKSTNVSGFCRTHLQDPYHNREHRDPVSPAVDPAEARRFEVSE